MMVDDYDMPYNAHGSLTSRIDAYWSTESVDKYTSIDAC